MRIREEKNNGIRKRDFKTRGKLGDLGMYL